ncbi:tetratricopeptide repeat protein [Duganella sp. P38]|uniref:tetratricopeptide repeat protein n=1 Tax=Duganella sp. P38 TaxID=3423949 RepID=UPI003D7A0252
MKYFRFAAVLLCLQLAGCATTTPAASADTPIPAAMEELGALAEQAIAIGDMRSAGRLYVRLVTAYPDSAPGWYRLGTVYLRTNQPGYAQQAFERALTLDPRLQKPTPTWPWRTWDSSAKRPSAPWPAVRSRPTTAAP